MPLAEPVVTEAQARDQTPWTVVVAGAAGSGKTLLIDQAIGNSCEPFARFRREGPVGWCGSDPDDDHTLGAHDRLAACPAIVATAVHALHVLVTHTPWSWKSSSPSMCCPTCASAAAVPPASVAAPLERVRASPPLRIPLQHSGVRAWAGLVRVGFDHTVGKRGGLDADARLASSWQSTEAAASPSPSAPQFPSLHAAALPALSSVAAVPSPHAVALERECAIPRELHDAVEYLLRLVAAATPAAVAVLPPSAVTAAQGSALPPYESPTLSAAAVAVPLAVADPSMPPLTHAAAVPLRMPASHSWFDAPLDSSALTDHYTRAQWGSGEVCALMAALRELRGYSPFAQPTFTLPADDAEGCAAFSLRHALEQGMALGGVSGVYDTIVSYFSSPLHPLAFLLHSLWRCRAVQHTYARRRELPRIADGAAELLDRLLVFGYRSRDADVTATVDLDADPLHAAAAPSDWSGCERAFAAVAAAAASGPPPAECGPHVPPLQRYLAYIRGGYGHGTKAYYGSLGPLTGARAGHGQPQRPMAPLVRPPIDCIPTRRDVLASGVLINPFGDADAGVDTAGGLLSVLPLHLRSEHDRYEATRFHGDNWAHFQWTALPFRFLQVVDTNGHAAARAAVVRSVTGGRAHGWGRGARTPRAFVFTVALSDADRPVAESRDALEYFAAFTRAAYAVRFEPEPLTFLVLTKADVLRANINAYASPADATAAIRIGWPDFAPAAQSGDVMADAVRHIATAYTQRYGGPRGTMALVSPIDGRNEPSAREFWEALHEHLQRQVMPRKPDQSRAYGSSRPTQRF